MYEDFRTGEPLLLPCHCCGCTHNLIAEWSIEIMESVVCDSDYSVVNFYYKPIRMGLFQRIKSAFCILFGLNDDYQLIDVDVEHAVMLKHCLDEFLTTHFDAVEAWKDL